MSEYASGMTDFWAGFSAESRDLRSNSDVPAISVWDTIKDFPGMPCIEIYPAGTTLDEKIELLQHAKAVAALLKSPKVQFRR